MKSEVPVAKQNESHDVLYGVHPIEEVLRGERRVLKLMLKDFGGERAALATAAKGQGIKTQIASMQELDRLSNGGNHQGAVALMEAYKYADLEDVLENLKGKPEALIVLLDSLKDVGNFGAILRTALSAGCNAVVIPQDRSVQVTAAVARSSAGAAERIPVCRVVNLVRAMEMLKAEGFWVFGTAAGKQPLWTADMTGRVALILGDEEKGMRNLVEKNCDVVVSIPMPGDFESLNVSAAAAVCLFEVVRQRAMKRKPA